MPIDDDRPRPPAGQRAVSRIRLEMDVIHDGDAEALARMMLVELEVVARRWGASIESTWVGEALTLQPGDDLSADLPTIRPPAAEDDL